MDDLLTRSHWLADGDAPGTPDPAVRDVHVALRGSFRLAVAAEITIMSLGASWYEASVDGAFVVEGPLRYPREHPELDSSTVRLDAGDHVLAVHAHSLGVDTRMLTAIEPFSCFVAFGPDGAEIPLEWRAVRLDGYAATERRLNPQLAWVEWHDTRRDPDGWTLPGFDDSAWPLAAPVRPAIGEPRAATIPSVPRLPVPTTELARGSLAEAYGYELDDPTARFFLRELDPAGADLPPDGVWLRFDLGRIRLVRPELDVTLPAGAVVEIAYAEQLRHDRVSPYITLSTGTSANLDHVVARGGRQLIRPLHPKGGRFAEVHVIGADPADVIVHDVTFVERCSVQPVGSFSCGDPLLEQIWATGVNTLLGCAEDALVDNPTRERGQWTGDLVSVGLDVTATVTADLRLIRRGLRQAAECARDDGLVAALGPGGVAYLPSFSAQWVPACLHYWELSGDHGLLTELYPAARANLAAFTAHLDDAGVHDGIGGNFVDWGYAGSAGPTDVALNLLVLAAARGMARWASAVDDHDGTAAYTTVAQRLARTLTDWFATHVAGDWARAGYHAAALALRHDLVPAGEQEACLAALHDHLLRCFPNDPTAPRNADPTVAEPRLITPYFAHFAFGPMIERGDMDFVADQYRSCWGWALGDTSDPLKARTTWVEVFDTRWSHCHAWSGAPTWQLSRYALGLHPRLDRGPASFDLKFHPGSLPGARGEIPVAGFANPIRVAWQRGDGDAVVLYVTSEVPLDIVHVSSDVPVRVEQARSSG